MNKNSKADYLNRFKRVLDHIDQNLDEDLNVDRLSDIASYSKYHFHRQFSAMLGMGINKFIRLKRIKRAAYQLYFYPEHKVIDIALDAHFENAESFSRAFKREIGQTPSQYRKKPDWKPWLEPYSFDIEEELEMNVEIIDFKELNVAAYEHQGPVETVNNSVGEFIKWRKKNKLSPAVSRSINILYDDPETVAPTDYRTDICAELKTPIKSDDDKIVMKIIPNGKCARYRHQGSWNGLERSIRALYGEWLPDSGEQLRDFPIFLEWKNFYPETPENELITDIYLPIK